MPKPPALVRRYVLVASLPGLCETCDRAERMWIRRVPDGPWTYAPCPHCTDPLPLYEILEGK